MSDYGIVTTAGRILRARLLSGESVEVPAWFAVGEGDWEDKTSPPSESPDATALAAEVARKHVSRVRYLTPDAGGTILYDGTLYAETTTPTPIVAFIAALTENEANGASICEEALFGGTVTTSAFPYALAAEVSVPGILYWVKHRPIVIKGLADTHELVAVFEA